MTGNFYWLPAMLSVLFGLIPIALTFQFGRQLALLLANPVAVPRAPVSVIVPCKGIDQGFAENIISFLTQDYPALQLIFVVATPEDPALPELRTLIAQHMMRNPHGHRVSVHIAGINNRRAQKLTNQLQGLNEVASGVEYLVFLDSDIRPDAGFIGRLVAPLQSARVGATTGFRWYHPPRPSLGSMLRSTWNAGALPLLTNPRTIFAFGGAMAIKRTTFVDAGIAHAWDKALSDDFPFTNGVQKLGLQIRFVPTCVAVSHESSTLAETLEFTNRQSVISRIYFPPLWWSAAFAHSIANLVVFLGAIGLAGSLATGWEPGSALAWCLLLIPMQCINALLLLHHIPRLLPRLHEQLAALRLRYVLCAPLASMMSLVNTLHSVTTRQIVWRGVRYELVSACETRVLPNL